MTDPTECPECHGEGETRIGPLRMGCTFCLGEGTVGGDNEPAERGADVDDNEPAPPWWEHPHAPDPGCRQCFGTGEVIALGGDVRGGVASGMRTRPCPECSSN